MYNTNVVVLYYFKDIYFVNFGKNFGSDAFLREDKYFGNSSKEDRYFGNKSFVGYFEVKILKPLLSKGFSLKHLKNNNLSSGQIIWQSTLKLTRRIGRSLLYRERENGEAGDFENNEDLKPLLMQRARLIGAASNKLTALRELMVSRKDTSHTLFYCSDGSPEAGERSSLRQLKAVAKILGVELGYKVSTYTAHTSLQEREILRRQFESGELQGLVAIRCLDEGVDIPAIQTAVILSSSGNPRQFIQRRGRVLRPHPGKERAIIYDMIVLPPDLERETIEVERNLLRKELRRFVEFADLADNAGEARMKLLALQKRYGLLDI